MTQEAFWWIFLLASFAIGFWTGRFWAVAVPLLGSVVLLAGAEVQWWDYVDPDFWPAQLLYMWLQSAGLAVAGVVLRVMITDWRRKA